MKKRNIALGFYQEFSTAQSVLAELKKRNFSRFATIYHKHDHSIEINRYFPFSALVIPFIGAISIVCLILLKYFSIIDFSWLAIMTGVSTIIAMVGIYTFWRFSELIDSDIINCFKNRVIVNEILIIAHVNYSDVREVLAILREVKSGHP